MTEYISREVLIEEIEEEIEAESSFKNGEKLITKGLKIVLKDVKKLPAADVQLVKRGKWVQIGEQSAKCTECNGVLKSNGVDKTGKALIFTVYIIIALTVA